MVYQLKQLTSCMHSVHSIVVKLTTHTVHNICAGAAKPSAGNSRRALGVPHPNIINDSSLDRSWCKALK